MCMYVCAVYIGESVIDCCRAGLGVNCRAVNRTICILICALHSRQEAGEAGHAIDVPRGRQGGQRVGTKCKLAVIGRQFVC